MIERLRAIADHAAVRERRDGDDVGGVQPRAVVIPETADACAALLAECSAQGWTVEVAGGRTARGSGRAIQRVDVLLSTERMSGILEYEPDDLTIGVAAGTTIAELRARVETHRQRVPLDPADARATVGGVLARGAAGPMRRAWGTARRQTLGIELVTGDGRVLRVGGRVVKNVAGYDLVKLVVGSAGTLGVITRAHLRLLPAPPAAATWLLAAGDPAPLCHAAHELLAAPVQPHALELIGAPWRLIAHYEAAADTLAAADERTAAVAARTGVGRARDDAALSRLATLERHATIAVRVASLPARLEELLAIAGRLAQDAGMVAETGAIAEVATAIAAHAGDGVVRVLLNANDSRGIAVDRLAAAVDQARRQLAGVGSVIVERAPAVVMRKLEPWGTLSEPVMSLTRELKRQFDPAGILQRGRWLS